jgi:hypothetical protein
MSSNKKRKKFHNKTVKNVKNVIKCKPDENDIKKYCNIHANTYSTFEEEYEKKLGKNLTEANKDVEKELIEMFRIPFTPGHIRPQDDYYT